MKKIFDFKVFALAATVLFIGCNPDEQNLINDYPTHDSMGFFSSDLQWENSEDQGTPITGISFVFAGSNSLFSRSYVSDEEFSKSFQQLPEGDYDVIAMINMTEAEGFSVSDVQVGKSVKVSLKDSTKLSAQAWYGVSKVSIKRDEVSIAAFKLQRLLPTLTVNINGLPADSKVAVSFDGMARNVNLNATGKYGMPSADSNGTLSLDAVPMSGGGKQSLTYNLFPTASALDSCLVSIRVYAPQGIERTYTKKLPRMSGGKSYLMNADFDDFKEAEKSLPLTFEAAQPGATIQFKISHEVAPNPVYYRRYRDSEWTDWAPYTSEYAVKLTNAGDKVQFKGDNQVYGSHLSVNHISHFSISKADCYVYGNIMSLVDSRNFYYCDTLREGYNFVNLFKANDNLLMLEDRRLVLPAVKLANDSYYGLFQMCSNLTVAPELPAKELDRWCYARMFKECVNLTEAPVLPAEKLEPRCYLEMFYGCNNLNSVVCLATDIFAEECTNQWMYLAGLDVSGEKTITLISGVAWSENNDSGIPNGWTRVDY